MSERFNSIRLSALLPELFEKSEHFSTKDYYNEMVRLFPQFKKKWWEQTPSEKDIQKMMIKDCGYGVIDGKESIPEAEARLGIKIGEDYKFPGGITDREYHIKRFFETGCEWYTDRVYNNAIANSKDKAYMVAWQSLHFHNYDEKTRVAYLQQRFAELCELNPQLKELKFDKNKEWSLVEAIAGTTYGFPVADMQMFISAHEKGETNVGKNNNARMKKEMAEAGLPEDFEPHWVLSSETIKTIGVRYKEKQARDKEKAKSQVQEMSAKVSSHMQSQQSTSEPQTEDKKKTSTMSAEMMQEVKSQHISKV